MATQLNPDGTVTEFKIGQEEPATVTVQATAEVKETKPKRSRSAQAKFDEHGNRLNKDGTVRKKMGPKKKFTNERKVLSGYIDVSDHNWLITKFGSGTNAIIKMLETIKQLETTNNE
jgi:hypothetical protein